MKKSCIIFIFLVLFLSFTFSQNQAFYNLFYSFHDVIDTMVTDYSSVSGLYTTGGMLKGSATIGSFPSFRVGTSLGIIFLRNPLNFMKEIDFMNVDWNSMKEDLAGESYEGTVNWLEENFIPLPITNIHFEVGLPKNMAIGGKFHILPINGFSNAGNPDLFNKFLLWGMGTHFNYTILKEYNKLPS
ncbi:MAG: hypothetical protein MJB14_21415, partial [Spirochaetes bacterium]|nr:hypothetical protein [Spirochaetota bacterium]